MDATVKTPRQLTAALGAGFYRYWHVPAPDAVLDIRTTRRADLSVIGPGAMALLAIGTWMAGWVGASLLLDERVTAPLSSLPWTARLLAGAGVAGLVLAALWWLGTAPVRARVARGVARGEVARIPDDPSAAAAPLHAAATQLGRTLRNLPDDLPEPPPLADPAFAVLRAAACLLADEPRTETGEQRRLRRRCLILAQRLEGTAGGREAHGSHEHAVA
jgi:hypothetical protein